MPALPRRPIAAAASSNWMPALLATGPTYLNDSPSIRMSSFAEADVLAKTSLRRPISSALIPYPDRMLEAMSPTSERSSRPAAARFSTPGRAVMISSTLKPAIAKNPMASAASDALNCVVLPSCLACSTSASKSLPVAPVTALTRIMLASKSPAVLIDARPTAATGSDRRLVSVAPVPDAADPTRPRDAVNPRAPSVACDAAGPNDCPNDRPAARPVAAAVAATRAWKPRRLGMTGTNAVPAWKAMSPPGKSAPRRGHELGIVGLDLGHGRTPGGLRGGQTVGDQLPLGRAAAAGLALQRRLRPRQRPVLRHPLTRIGRRRQMQQLTEPVRDQRELLVVGRPLRQRRRRGRPPLNQVTDLVG